MSMPNYSEIDCVTRYISKPKLRAAMRAHALGWRLYRTKLQGQAKSHLAWAKFYRDASLAVVYQAAVLSTSKGGAQ